MSGAALARRGGRRAQREVVDVIEPAKQDRSVDQLILVRRQRIERFERERREARLSWRQSRQALHELRQRWRAALVAAHTFWQEARTGFFKLAITSGQFRRAKATYERMKQEAAQLQLDSRAALAPCRTARAEFFAARLRVLDAHRQHEKLRLLREEMRLLHAQPEP